MDHLDLCMRKCEADGYGPHYGLWVAKTGGIPRVEEDRIPEGWKKCEYCGMVYRPFRSDQKFCGATCQKSAYEKRYKRPRRGSKNGKT